jgi:ABC-type taurine transport system substrate-binding protein
MRNQTSDVEGKRMANDKNYTSKDTQTQTDLYGDGAEKLLDTQAKYLEKQLEVDTNLR